ncbi:MAG: hypothetical protein WD577_03135 [Bacteroidales bacterium]
MRKRGLSILIALFMVAIIVVIIADYVSQQPDKLGVNPYEFNVDEYRAVDTALITYRETKNFPVRGYKAEGMHIRDGVIWLTGNEVLQAVTTEGVQLLKTAIDGTGTCIHATDKAVFIGFGDHLKKYSREGELTATWEVPGKKCVFTSMAANDQMLYVADAGNRRVLRYGFDGELLGEFKGKSESAAGHGFILPSACFDLVVNSYDELWVVNTGKHAIENYSNDGKMRGFWQKGSMTIEGFAGCCNPAELAVLSDGSFVTSEKGLVRIKVYDSSGELQGVVAAPDKFIKDGKAPEVAVDENDVIYALDFDKSTIRVFEKK